MATTIYDVAQKAGVGIGTVSRVLNRSTHTTPQTRRKVLQAARVLRYRPHAMARGLARNRTGTLAVVLPLFSGPFYFELLRALQRAASSSGHDLILYSADRPDRPYASLEKTLRERRVDGLLLLSHPVSDAFARRCLRQRLPVVLVDCQHPDLDSITVENASGAHAATDYLVGLGHRRIGMIDGRLSSAPARQRLDGYRRALREHGIPFDRRFLFVAGAEEADGFNRAAGYAGLKRLAGLGAERPTAVFVSSDIQALGAMRAAGEAGFDIPRDLSVVGFDDVELAGAAGLTTMRQPLEAMAALAVGRLLDRVAERADGVLQHRFSTELVVRGTSAPPPAAPAPGPRTKTIPNGAMP